MTPLLKTCALAATALCATLTLAACDRRPDVAASQAGADHVLERDQSSNVPAVTEASSPQAVIDSNPTGAGNPLSATDSALIAQAAEGGMFEIEVAKLASDKASDPAVKSFAAMLLQDHLAALSKLQQVATRHQVTLPSGVPQSKQSELSRLGEATGPEFDRQFVQAVGVQDHKDDIALFEDASRSAKDPDVREFFESALPTLRAHLSAAQNLPVSKAAKNPNN